MIQIVVLDGYTLNPGDLSWDPLSKLGNVEIYDRTPMEEIVSRASHAEIVLTNKTPITAELLSKLPKLKYIGVLATGYNIVDIEAARQRGIPVTNIPTYGTKSVAQFVFALLLELCSRVQMHSDSVHSGEWTRSQDFCFTKAPLIELADKTMGLIGVGRIGLQTAQIANAFGMKVIAMGSGRKPPVPIDGIEWVDKATLFQEADVLSLHCPLTPETNQIIRAEWLAMMKPSALLINTSRGGLIHETDLADALRAGTIAGAAVDVLSVEPPGQNHPLLQAPNCIVTPHVAWATKEARSRLMNTAVQNIERFLVGDIVNAVNV